MPEVKIGNIQGCIFLIKTIGPFILWNTGHPRPHDENTILLYILFFHVWGIVWKSNQHQSWKEGNLGNKQENIRCTHEVWKQTYSWGVSVLCNFLITQRSSHRVSFLFWINDFFVFCSAPVTICIASICLSRISPSRTAFCQWLPIMIDHDWHSSKNAIMNYNDWWWSFKKNSEKW